MGDDAVSPLREPPVRATESRSGAVVITLVGELDLYNADEVRAAFVKALDDGATILVVDMAAVEFMDSTALGVLVEARSKLGNDGLRLAAPQLGARRTLQVSGLDRHLPVYDSVDAALG
jgi:anti-sigma B factor antagonist